MVDQMDILDTVGNDEKLEVLQVMSARSEHDCFWLAVHYWLQAKAQFRAKEVASVLLEYARHRKHCQQVVLY